MFIYARWLAKKAKLFFEIIDEAKKKQEVILDHYQAMSFLVQLFNNLSIEQLFHLIQTA